MWCVDPATIPASLRMTSSVRWRTQGMSGPFQVSWQPNRDLLASDPRRWELGRAEPFWVTFPFKAYFSLARHISWDSILSGQTLSNSQPRYTSNLIVRGAHLEDGFTFKPCLESSHFMAYPCLLHQEADDKYVTGCNQYSWCHYSFMIMKHHEPLITSMNEHQWLILSHWSSSGWWFGTFFLTFFHMTLECHHPNCIASSL